MATNTNLTIDMITKRALMILHQKLNFIGSIDRQYDSSFAKTGAKIGSTLRIRKPVQYTTRTGKVIDIQNSEETKVDLAVATQKGVDFEFDSSELALDIDDFAMRYLDPAISVLAANIEYDAISGMRTSVYNCVDGGSDGTTVADVLKCGKVLTDNLAPLSGRVLNMSTQQMVDLVTDTKGLFNDQQKISSQYREGLMGQNTLGFSKIYQNTLIPQYSSGAANTSYVTNGATSTQGATSIVVQTGSGAAEAGQVFTIADVYRVHPETKVSTGELQQFVLTNAESSGAGTWEFTPAVYSTGAKQNVDSLPGASKAITFVSTLSTDDDMSIAYHPSAFTFATADLPLPKGRDIASRQQFEGLSMRIIRDYDITNDTFPCRIDVLYGYVAQRPELATLLLNN